MIRILLLGTSFLLNTAPNIFESESMASCARRAVLARMPDFSAFFSDVEHPPVEAVSDVNLLIGADGRVKQCEATGAQPDYNLAACNALLRQARYKPALDHLCRAAEERKVAKVRWRLESDPAEP